MAASVSYSVVRAALQPPRAQQAPRSISRSAIQAFRPSLAAASAGRRGAARSDRRALQVVAARVENNDVELGFKAPDFSLVDATTGETVQLSSYAAGAPATLIMVLSRHCLFVVHLKAAIAQLARDYQAKGVKVLAVGSNSVETHPQDGPEGMAQDVKEYNFSFPYLFDETQDVAKAYKAACTPEFYVFDSNLRLTYHGQFDDTRPAKKGGDGREATGEDLRHALDCTLAGTPNERKIRNSIGCNIKWKPGNAPAWFHG